MSEPEFYQRQIVVDQPAREDVFEGKGHLRTARQLAKTIVEFDDEDRSIGLEGDWGAGKSTVVRLAAKELSGIEGRNFRFFTFDMWSNQTSPFRRTFLEKLLDWGKREVINDKSRVQRLDELLDRVRDRIVTTKSDSFRRLDWFGILFILLAPMLPLALAWLSPLSISPRSGPAVSFMIWGLTVPFWILGLLIIGLLYSAFLYRVKQRAKKENVTFFEALSMAASLFTKQQENETTTQNIREEDPNEYEFEVTLLDTLQALQENGDRVVIVFDNIDRLPKDSISDAWADIRAVFSGDPSNPNKGQRSCTAIVPYDRDHVLGAISSDRDNYSSEKELFRKTFDEILRVSPPVASNVLEHVEATLRRGLPNFVDTGAIYNVTKIFQRSTQAQDRPVTPRQVISFVNEVSSVFAQWEGTIPLDTVAIYQVFRDEIENQPRSLTAMSDDLTPYLVNSNDADLYRHLAAIAYNVEPHLAYQVLLEGPLSAALVDKEPDQIQTLYGSPGFSQVLVRVLEAQVANWAQEGVIPFANVAKNLSAVSLDDWAHSHVMTLYLSGLDDLKVAKFEKPEDVECLSAVIDICSIEQRPAILLRLADWMTSCFDVEKATFEDGRIWVKAFGKLFSGADGAVKALAEPVLREFRLPSNVDFVLGVAYDCDEIDLTFSDFQHSVPSSKFLGPLKTFCKDEPQVFCYVFDQIRSSRILSESDRFALLQYQKDQITGGTFAADDGDFAMRAENFIATYGAISKRVEARDVLDQVVANGTLAWHADATKEFKSADRALAAAVWLTLQSLKTKPFEIGQNSNQPPFGNLYPARAWLGQYLTGTVELPDSVVDRLASHVVDQRVVSSWLKLAAEDSPSKKIFNAVLRRVCGKEDLYPISLETLLSHYDFMRKVFDGKMDRVLELTGRSERDVDIDELELEALPARLIQDTAGREEFGWTRFHAKVEEALVKILDDDWRQYLTNDSSVLSIVAAEASLKGFKLPAHRFQEPFSDFIVELMSGEAQLGERTNLTEQILNAIPPKARAAMPKAIGDRMRSVSTRKEGFVYVYSKFSSLVDEVFIKSADGEKVRNFATPAIASATEQGLSFVESHAVSLKQALLKADDGDRGHFVEVFKDVLSEYDPRHVQSVANAIGVNLEDSDSFISPSSDDDG